jgi:hypothetical protein
MTNMTLAQRVLVTFSMIVSHLAVATQSSTEVNVK